jgi:hypothetical protein
MELEDNDLDHGDRRTTEGVTAAKEEGAAPASGGEGGIGGFFFCAGRLRRFCWRSEVLRGRGTNCAQGK